jgi:hypothetical protein
MGNWCRSTLLERAWDRGDLIDEQSMDVMNPYWDFLELLFLVSGSIWLDKVIKGGWDVESDKYLDTALIPS